MSVSFAGLFVDMLPAAAHKHSGNKSALRTLMREWLDESHGKPVGSGEGEEQTSLLGLYELTYHLNSNSN